MKKASIFAIKNGKNVFIPAGGMLDRASVPRAIFALMRKYDGVKAIPNYSGNRGNDPAKHHFSIWLQGIEGYILPRAEVGTRKGAKTIDKFFERNRQLQKRKANERKRTTRKGKK